MSALSQFIGGGNRIKSIQHISSTLDFATQSRIVTISAVTPSKTIVSLTDNTIVNGGIVDQSLILTNAVVYLYSSTSLYFSIATDSGSRTTTLAATVVEFF